jgi:hypothetical protein
LTYEVGYGAADRGGGAVDACVLGGVRRGKRARRKEEKGVEGKGGRRLTNRRRAGGGAHDWEGLGYAM